MKSKLFIGAIFLLLVSSLSAQEFMTDRDDNRQIQYYRLVKNWLLNQKVEFNPSKAVSLTSKSVSYFVTMTYHGFIDEKFSIKSGKSLKLVLDGKEYLYPALMVGSPSVDFVGMEKATYGVYPLAQEDLTRIMGSKEVVVVLYGEEGSVETKFSGPAMDWFRKFYEAYVAVK